MHSVLSRTFNRAFGGRIGGSYSPLAVNSSFRHCLHSEMKRRLKQEKKQREKEIKAQLQEAQNTKSDKVLNLVIVATIQSNIQKYQVGYVDSVQSPKTGDVSENLDPNVSESVVFLVVWSVMVKELCLFVRFHRAPTAILQATESNDQTVEADRAASLSS